MNKKNYTLHFFYEIFLFYSMTACALLIISFFFTNSAKAEQIIINSNTQYEYAQKLFNSHDYETAIVEYKRFIHFFPENIDFDKAQFKVALCLFNLKKYHEAAKLFNDIIIKSKNKNIIQEVVFFQSKTFMQLGNTGYAQIVLQNYLKLTDDIKVKDKIYFHLALIHLMNAKKMWTKNSLQGSFAHAKKWLLKISPASADQFKIDIYNEIIFKAEHARTKNPKVAGLFAIIPGVGFLYCERFHDAFITFLLNTGLMVAAWEAWEHDNKALASVIGFVETGFYTGNIYGSISSAHKYNQSQIIKVLGKNISIESKLDPINKAYGLSFNFDF